MPAKINMINYEFNGCKVISESEMIGCRLAYNCVCYCGKDFKATAKAIRSGAKRSCGCARKGINKKHGMCGTSEYRSWAGMLQRCNNPKNPKYKNYGGRGIKPCKKWYEFQNFIEDMGVMPSNGMSIGRINNNEGYHPLNCRWENDAQQADNTTRSVVFCYRGQELTAREVSCINGLEYRLVYSRLKKGLSDDEIDFGSSLRAVNVLVNGNNMRLMDAIKLLDIPISTFYKRRRVGAEPQAIIDHKIKHGCI